MTWPRALSRLLRRTVGAGLRRLTFPKLEIVYHDRFNAALPGGLPNDPLRAERILAFLAGEGLVMRRCVHQPYPARLATLERLHGAGYLEGVQDTRTLTSIMGTEISSEQVDRLIDHQRLICGGTLLAVRLALARRGTAINLGGGMHHAHADHGGGFCIFNDMAVAIAAERARGFSEPVLIVDLDMHDGDGTRSIYADDPTVHTFSIHARHWGPTEAVASTSLELGPAVGDATYLEALEEHLPPVLESVRPGLVIYLAGTDGAEEDALGSWHLSTEGMLRRDRFVMEQLERAGSSVPRVILLAGGYGAETWRLSARFFSTLLRYGARALEPPTTEEITLKRYRYIHRLLGPQELSTPLEADNEFGLSAEDLQLPGWGVTKETRFLGYYTKHGLELILERGGFLERLRDLGFAQPTLSLQLEDPNGHALRIYGSPAREDVLVELRVRRDRQTVTGLELLALEWLLLQNPKASFGPGREPLPGQEHPGLGMVADVGAMLALACERLHLDGLIHTPSELHVARISESTLRFVDPIAERRYRAILEAVQGLPFAEASQAVAAGRLRDRHTGEPVRWDPSPMVLPVSDKFRDLLDRRYQQAAAEGLPDIAYRLVS